MTAFAITVRQFGHHPLHFFAIGASAAAVGEAAADRFGVCGITIKPI